MATKVNNDGDTLKIGDRVMFKSGTEYSGKLLRFDGDYCVVAVDDAETCRQDEMRSHYKRTYLDG